MLSEKCKLQGDDFSAMTFQGTGLRGEREVGVPTVGSLPEGPESVLRLSLPLYRVRTLWEVAICTPGKGSSPNTNAENTFLLGLQPTEL